MCVCVQAGIRGAAVAASMGTVSKPHWNSSGLPWLPGYLSHDDAKKWPNLEPLPLSPEQEYSAEEKKKADIKSKLLEIHKEAAMYYYHLLRSEKGQRAYEYLKGRGLSDETIKNFGLGYSSNYSDDLYRYIKSKGYTDDVLKESGLFTFSEKGVYDKFNNRVMFPIMDINNRVIGFGGRVMGDGKPKYLNSPETILFDKSRNLYGMNIARSSTPPLTCRVMEPFSTFCILPIMDAAESTRPKAAVAVGSVL